MEFSAGTVDITPIKPAVLGGYGNRHDIFTGVSDRLEGNAILIAGRNTRVFFVTVDALYPGKLLRDRLLSELGLTDNELFLAASHTHFAPMVSPGMPGLGTHDIDYIEFAAERLISLAHRLLKGAASPVHCLRREGLAHHSINRRLPRWRLGKSGLSYTWGLAPNANGERDERLEILQFCNDHNTNAILWNYACHPTDFPEVMRVSADFPGVVRARLREEFGDIPVLFLQGFSGDTRPPFRGLSGMSGLVRFALQGPQFRRPGFAEWHAWADDLATVVLASLRSKITPIYLTELVSTRHEIAEHKLGTGGNGDKPLIWHNIDLGGVGVIGVNAEPVTAYRRLIESHFPGKPVLTAGCIDQTHGYLPTDRMLEQGGYEVEGFRSLFSYKTQFQAGLQEAAISPFKSIIG